MKLRPEVFFLIFLTVLFCGCSSTKYVPDGEYLLDEIKVRSTDKDVKVGDLANYLRQQPNARWFSLFKVPLYVYGWSGRDTTEWINRVLRRVGDAPVIYNEEESLIGEREMLKALRNRGYMEGRIERRETTKKKKTRIEYTVVPGHPYVVDRIYRVIPDSAIRVLVEREDSLASLLRPGMLLDISVLDRERNRIVTLLRNNGYYEFNKDYVSYAIDTLAESHTARVALFLDPVRKTVDSQRKSHIPYRVSSIRIHPDFDLFSEREEVSLQEGDTLHYGKVSIVTEHAEKPYLRPKVLLSSLNLHPDSLYSEQGVTDTYSRLARLGILRYTNMRFEVHPETGLLDCDLYLSKGKNRSVSFSVEGTNSAGDLGAAASITTEHRNLFRGSETFSLKLRGAYEAISGLSNAITDRYTEYGIEAGLHFPRFLFPFISSQYRRKTRATTELVVGYSNQKRPEFARNIFEGRWSYKWSRRNQHSQHRVDLVEVSYIKMPWISDEYRNNYLQNSILKYNYDDQLIMKTGYGIVFSSAGIGDFGAMNKTSENSYTIRMNIESAGNLLYGFSKMLGATANAEGRYSSFGLPYEQYVKGDFDISGKIRIDYRNSLAMHLALGVAYPYGNADMLPFSKRYFAGGANGVRGWSVRRLGPGRYSGGNSIDFMNRSGDIKLDMSVELRSKLFWKLNGAFFVDAGNIWTIREYDSQPGGMFSFDSFYKELAVSYGLGLRFDFDYFILRFDGAMRAVDPTWGEERYPLWHPDFSRDFTFHFAIGYPF